MKNLLMRRLKHMSYFGKTGCGFVLGVSYVMTLSWFNPHVYDEYILWFHDLFSLIDAITNSR